MNWSINNNLRNHVPSTVFMILSTCNSHKKNHMTVIQLISKDEIYQYPHTCTFISITYKSHLEYQAFTPEML